MSWLSSLNVAGGHRYHLRAFWHAKQRWAPFRQALWAWADEFRHVAKTWLIVGPSGGYNFPLPLLEQVERAYVLEPDPLARFIFGKRLTRQHIPDIQWVSQDWLLQPLLRPEPSALEGFLQNQADAAVIFCNILGQVRFLMPEASFPIWQSAFQTRILPLLQHRPWLSFHDRLSGEIRPELNEPSTHARRLTNDELADLYPRFVPANRSEELVDHLTYELFKPNQAAHYFAWELEPHRYHLIEGLSHIPR